MVLLKYYRQNLLKNINLILTWIEKLNKHNLMGHNSFLIVIEELYSLILLIVAQNHLSYFVLVSILKYTLNLVLAIRTINNLLSFKFQYKKESFFIMIIKNDIN